MISVALATHNGQRYIRQQITSILRQLSAEDEIIISDDGSTDRTIEIIRHIGSPLIKIVHLTPDTALPLPERIGRNFGNALQHCRGEYIFIADQDDIWLPNKVKRMVEALQEYDLAVSDSLIMEPHCRCQRSFYGRRSPLRNYLLLGAKYQGCCLAMRRRIVEKMLPFPRRMPLYDTYLGLGGELIGRATYIKEPLIIHRQHDGNASRSTHNPLHYKISYRIRLLVQIYRRAIKHYVEQLKKGKIWRV